MKIIQHPDHPGHFKVCCSEHELADLALAVAALVMSYPGASTPKTRETDGYFRRISDLAMTITDAFEEELSCND